MPPLAAAVLLLTEALRASDTVAEKVCKSRDFRDSGNNRDIEQTRALTRGASIKWRTDGKLNLRLLRTGEQILNLIELFAHRIFRTVIL